MAEFDHYGYQATPDLYTDFDSDWAQLMHYPQYTIHVGGSIYDTLKGREISQIWNDAYQVNLRVTDEYGNLAQTTRRVATLVAETFVPKEQVEGLPEFDTVMFLDGDFANHHADNLVWRPRPLAIRYHKEMRDPDLLAHRSPILDEEANVYEGLVDAAMSFGTCMTMIRNSIVLHRPEGFTGIQFYDPKLIENFNEGDIYR